MSRVCISNNECSIINFEVYWRNEPGGFPLNSKNEKVPACRDFIIGVTKL